MVERGTVNPQVGGSNPLPGAKSIYFTENPVSIHAINFCYNLGMDLLLLSGNSKRGKDWLKQVDMHLAPQFDQTYRHDYAHWEKDEPEIDLNIESQRLSKLAQNLPPYMIFAKSVGTILTSKNIALGTLRPRACLFIGLPLAMVHSQKLPVKEWLKKADCPIAILQHKSDPLGSYQEVEQYIEAVNRDNITVHELPGNTHDYLEFQIFNNFVRELAR